MRMRWLAPVAIVSLMLTITSMSAAASIADGGTDRFCTPSRVIADQVARPLLSVSPQQMAVLRRTLERTAKSAPRSVKRAMQRLAHVYSTTARATSDADRAKLAYASAVTFQTAQKSFTQYYSTHCVATPVTSPNLPGVNAANQAACLADARTLQIAETEYSALNGGYATMDQLVSAGIVRSRSVMHPEITVGTPPGGYTLVGNQVCNNLPVAG
jgi:hypothetical protein